jgi:hypothetical protein
MKFTVSPIRQVGRVYFALAGKGSAGATAGWMVPQPFLADEKAKRQEQNKAVGEARGAGTG